MGELCRIGVAIDEDLLARFDSFNDSRGYSNRSEAFRDLIRDALIQHKTLDADALVVGTLTLVYDHHVRLLSDKLNDLQHDHHHDIISTLHVHLDHHHCLEVLVLRGRSADVRRLADLLISVKGVQHGQLVMTAAS